MPAYLAFAAYHHLKLVDAVEMRDYPVIQAEVLLFSLQFILINLIVDMLYGVINPTIRYK